MLNLLILNEGEFVNFIDLDCDGPRLQKNLSTQSPPAYGRRPPYFFAGPHRASLFPSSPDSDRLRP
jgi:hypothetical protein